MTIITKDIKYTSRIRQFKKLDIEDKRLHRSNPYIANAPRPLAEKYERSKIEAS